MSKRDLLGVRLCDLNLELRGTWLERAVLSLYEDLEARDLRVKPHVWLSTEWFCPDGVPGIAIPFFLAHPRLAALERSMMMEVEGGNQSWCMKILRHEAGHAVQNAFRLHRRRQWQQIFGHATEPYPEVYQPRPGSKRYVLNLYFWYAQSHPAEDFAETFAVWLRPGFNWRRAYEGWPALEKLEYVHDIMTDLAGETPPVRSKRTVDALSRLTMTLGEYYEQKQSEYAVGYPDIYDGDLRRLFTAQGREAASTFLRRHRREIRAMVARWTGEAQFTLDQVLRDMIGRVRELGLRVSGNERAVKLDFAILLTVRTMQYLHRHRQWHAL